MPNKWDRVDKAYDFLLAALSTSQVFSLAELAAATGWAETTVETYASKKWIALVVAEGSGFRCTDGLKKHTRASFRRHHSQVSSRMPTLSDRLLSKAVAACISAIEIYNKPDFRFRNENFAILLGSAWELLLKAKLVQNGDEKSQAINSLDKNGNVILSKSGNPRTISLMTAAERLHMDGTLPKAAFDNLRILACIRDDAVHLIADDLELNRRFQEIGIAGVRNFATAASAWFAFDFGQFNMFLMPLSFAGSTKTEMVGTRSSEAEKLFKLVSSIQDADSGDQDPDYSVALRLDARFVKTDAADALKVRISRDPDATPIRLTDDDFFERYPHTHAQLVDILRKRYSNFKQNNEFNERLAKLRLDVQDLYVERRLNPKNPRSTYQRFYHNKAVEAFDPYYLRKTAPG